MPSTVSWSLGMREIMVTITFTSTSLPLFVTRFTFNVLNPAFKETETVTGISEFKLPPFDDCTSPVALKSPFPEKVQICSVVPSFENL